MNYYKNSPTSLFVRNKTDYQLHKLQASMRSWEWFAQMFKCLSPSLAKLSYAQNPSELDSSATFGLRKS
jgi:hypothetical protein